MMWVDSPAMVGAATAASEAEALGQLIGTGLILVLFVLGIVKCVRIMKRPATSRLCVAALVVCLATWLLCTLMAGAKAHVGEMPPWASALVGMLVLGMFLSALILGIVGLVTYDKQRFRQGRAQAVWTIVLCSLILVVGVAKRVSREVMTENPAAGRTINGGVIKRPDFNFSIQPGSGWLELDPKAVNPAACLWLRRLKPEVHCMVIAETSGVEISLPMLAEIVKSNLGAAYDIQKQTTKDTVVNGIDFKKIETTGKAKGTNLLLDLEHWVATRNGYAWQVFFWAGSGTPELSSMARKTMDSFQLLDPAASMLPGNQIEDVERPEWGYKTSLDSLNWAKWAGDGGSPLLDFRAQRPNEVVLVLPLRISPPPPMPVLIKGLLSSCDLDDVADSNIRVKTWDPGHGGEGRELLLDKVVHGDPVRYLMRVARRDDCAHLVGGWAVAPAGDIEIVRQALEAIELFPPQGEPPAVEGEQSRKLGSMFNEFGIDCLRKDWNDQAAEWFKKAFDRLPDPVVLGNLGDTCERLEKAAEGRDLLAPHIEAFPDNTYVGLCYARLLAMAGDLEQAETWFAKQLDAGLKDEDDLLAWLQLLNRGGHHASAVRAADAWVQRMPTTKSRIWQAQTVSAAGDTAQAIHLLEKLRSEHPDDLEVAYNLGELCNEDGRSTEAAAVAEAVLKEVDGSPRALMILGWSQMARKWYRDAKQSFEQAAKGWPDDEDVQEAIRRAAAELGQGDNTDIRQPLEVVAIPVELEQVIAAQQPPATAGTGQAALWERRVTGHAFRKGELARRTYHNRVRILTHEGARDFSSVSCGFNPLSERIFLNRLAVIDESGKVLHLAGANDVYVRDEDDGTASDRKVLHAQVAGVRPGVVVEWQITIQDRGTADGLEFNRHLFVSRMESVVDAVFVVGDVDQVAATTWQGEHLHEVTAKQLRGWVDGYRPAPVGEPHAVPHEHRCPVLWLGKPGTTWQAVGDHYLKEIDDRLTASPPVRALASQVAGKQTTVADKVAAIMAHVQKEVAYQAIEFGVRGRRPNAAETTLELRYGDCKDMAVLVVQLLQAVGVKAHPALVHTEWDIEPSLATIDQFNHMVVHVPALGQGWLLDPTDKFLAQPQVRADGLWATRALVLEPSASRLIELPTTAAAGSSRLASRRVVTLDDRDWQVHEVLELDGYLASWMRQAFSGLNDEEQHRRAQGILSGLGTVRLHGFQFEHLDHPQQPARLVMDYTVPQVVTEVGGHRTAIIPSFWEDDYLQTKYVRSRTTDFQWLYPMRISSEVEVRLPAGTRTAELAGWPAKHASEFCRWSTTAETGDGGVRLAMDFEAQAGHRFPAAAYPRFHEAWEQARHALGKPFTWTPGASPPAE